MKLRFYTTDAAWKQAALLSLEPDEDKLEYEPVVAFLNDAELSYPHASYFWAKIIYDSGLDQNFLSQEIVASEWIYITIQHDLVRIEFDLDCMGLDISSIRYIKPWQLLKAVIYFHDYCQGYMGNEDFILDLSSPEPQPFYRR